MAANVQDPELEDQEVELEELEGEEEELSFFDRYRTPIIAGGAVVVALILGLVGWNYLKGQENVEANAAMFKAIEKFEGDSLDLAIRGDGTFLGLEDIAIDYSGTQAADQANYYLGIAYLKSDSLDDAIGMEYLEKVGGSDHSLAMARDVALAFAHERQEDFSGAARLFEKAATTPGENDQTTPFLLMEAGRCYELAGEPDKALDLYESIRDDFPESQEANGINKYIGRVSP